MPNNYGLKSREMAKAGLFACRAATARGELSFASAALLGDRWGLFCRWVRPRGVKWMEHVTRDLAREYGRELAERVAAEDMTPATAQIYLSAVNTVMSLATRGEWKTVSPTRDCGIPKRNYIAVINKAVLPEQHEAACGRASERLRALLLLQRELGLRFKESSLLDARAALKEATKGHVSIVKGTKGGRLRKVPITRASQLAALRFACAIQGHDRSLVPAEMSYAQWQDRAYQEARAIGIRFHGERHAYAQSRYLALLGVPCPVEVGIPHGRRHHEYIALKLGVSVEQAAKLDAEARLKIAEELGHGRAQITNVYLG